MRGRLTERMQPEFAALWLAIADDDSAHAEQVFQVLADRYSAPGRHYHNLDHVNHCLGQARLVVGLLPDTRALETAIWFHDVVYDVRTGDNEARSATLFRQMAGPVMPSGVVDDVERLVLVTRVGRTPNQADEEYMVDVDYSSFGLPWAPFLADSLAVRAEQSHLTDDQYAVQQSRMLTGLLRREAVFRTDLFRARYEDTARSNIARYLEAISRR